jgi:hypothetical protein
MGATPSGDSGRKNWRRVYPKGIAIEKQKRQTVVAKN